jgi:ribose transport system ATP-binding protein
MSAALSGAATLALENVTKRFGPVRALSDVSFSVGAGEVVALVGENGAGKSTLLKILGGAHAPDRGRITMDGRPVTIAGPAEAARLGVAIIHQELNLIPWLSVAQNLFLGREREVGRVFVSRRRLRAAARAALDRLGIELDPDAPVARLGVAAQQMVEIARALSMRTRFLLMDEPTAALGAREIAPLFHRIAALRSQGVGVVYISHRLEEVQQIADRVIVLRDGAVVHQAPLGGTSMDAIVAHMVGRPIGDRFPRRTPAPGAERLRVEDRDPECPALTVRAGEVVGIAGLVGAGRTEWLWRLFGANPVPPRLRVLVDGRPAVIGSPRAARTLGLGMVPESRKEHGLILGLSILDNATITLLDRLRTRLGLLDRPRRTAIARHFIERLRVRCTGPDAPVETLSGGNQQKVVIAKWLARDCPVLLLDEPTRGVDVGAKQEIYMLINELVGQGKSVVLVSSELPELIAMSDRIYVMREGRFVAELDAARTSQDEILAHASGRGALAA